MGMFPCYRRLQTKIDEITQDEPFKLAHQCLQHNSILLVTIKCEPYGTEHQEVNAFSVSNNITYDNIKSWHNPVQPERISSKTVIKTNES